MKRTIPYRILTVLASLSIFIIVTFIAIMVPANSKSFYKWQFEKNQTLSWVQSQSSYLDYPLSEDYDPYAADYVENMTEQQLEDLMMHVMRYLTWLEDDVNITVEDRYLNIFTANEKSHLKDVRVVFGVFIILSILSMLFCMVYLFFLINRPKQYYDTSRKIPFITFAVIMALYISFVVWAIVDFKYVYEVFFHNLLFSGNYAFSHGVMVSMISEIFPDIAICVGVSIPVLLSIPTLAFALYNRSIRKKIAKAEQESIKAEQEIENNRKF